MNRWIPEQPIVVQSMSPLEFYQNVNMSIPTVFIVPPVETGCVRWSYLLGVEVNRDHEGGSSRARPHHCTAMQATPTISLNEGNSGA